LIDKLKFYPYNTLHKTVKLGPRKSIRVTQIFYRFSGICILNEIKV